MLMGWNALAGFATMILAVLSFVAQPWLRSRMRVGAGASALIFLGLLAGPAFDQIAGAIILALVIWLVFVAIRSGSFF